MQIARKHKKSPVSHRCYNCGCLDILVPKCLLPCHVPQETDGLPAENQTSLRKCGGPQITKIKKNIHSRESKVHKDSRKASGNLYPRVARLQRVVVCVCMTKRCGGRCEGKGPSHFVVTKLFVPGVVVSAGQPAREVCYSEAEVRVHMMQHEVPLLDSRKKCMKECTHAQRGLREA